VKRPAIETRIIARLRSHYRSVVKSDGAGPVGFPHDTWGGPPDGKGWSRGWRVGFRAAISLIESGYATRSPAEVKRVRAWAKRYAAKIARKPADAGKGGEVIDDDFDTLDFLIDLRGGMPEKCDFCGGPINGDPIPEEAGDWACRQCFERWEEEDRKRKPADVVEIGQSPPEGPQPPIGGEDMRTRPAPKRWTLHTDGETKAPVVCTGQEYCWYCYAPSDHKLSQKIVVVPESALRECELERDEVVGMYTHAGAEIDRLVAALREAEAKIAYLEKLEVGYTRNVCPVHRDVEQELEDAEASISSVQSTCSTLEGLLREANRRLAEAEAQLVNLADLLERVENENPSRELYEEVRAALDKFGRREK